MGAVGNLAETVCEAPGLLGPTDKKAAVMRLKFYPWKLSRSVYLSVSLSLSLDFHTAPELWRGVGKVSKHGA